jgi:hypothetical protein
VTTYREKRKHTRLGGVDVNGNPHPELTFDEDGLLEVSDDDEQTYGQTLRNALDAGSITHAKKEK